MYPPSLKVYSTNFARSISDIKSKEKPQLPQKNPQPVKTSPATINPKDSSIARRVQNDNLTRQISFSGKLPPKKEDDNIVKKVTAKVHKGHVGYELAVSSSKVIGNTAKTALRSGGSIGKTVGKTLYTTSKALNTAHHATQAAQISNAGSLSKTLGRVGLTKGANVVSSLAKHGHHAGHVAKATKVLKVVTVAGKLAPGVGFAAGVVGAGLAINDAVKSKTTVGKVGHSIRAGLNAIGAVSSTLPVAGTLVAVLTTGADILIDKGIKRYESQAVRRTR